jgi:hypothetical protein
MNTTSCKSHFSFNTENDFQVEFDLKKFNSSVAEFILWKEISKHFHWGIYTSDLY